MSSLVASFDAYIALGTEETESTFEGTVRLKEDTLDLYDGDEEQVSVLLEKIIDINNSVPMFVSSMPGESITIGFREGLNHGSAVVSCEEATSEKFRKVLFMAILNDTSITIKHPAKKGGHVADMEFTSGDLFLNDGSLTVKTDEDSVLVDIGRIMNVMRGSREINGFEKPVFIVTHTTSGESVSTILSTDSQRTMSLLGRFLHREYQDALSALNDIELSTPETEVLATLYTRDGDASLSSILEIDSESVKQLLSSLHDKELVKSRNGSPVLTHEGEIVVNQYLDQIPA